MADPPPSSVGAAVNIQPQTKAGVPYEVFLHVVEQLIEMAKDRYDVKVWSLGYEHSLATKLVLHELNSTRVRSETITHQRHQKLRLALQINQQSRRMVEKTFARLPMMVANPDGLTRSLSPVKAYVPLTDEYIPFFTSLQEGREFEQFIYNQAILLPSASGYALLTRIEKILLPFSRYLITENEESLATLVRLPNLKSIVFNVGGFSSKLRNSMKPGLHKVDSKNFPDLAKFCTRRSSALRTLWVNHLHNRGIKLLGFIDSNQDPIIELHPSLERILISYLLPYANEALEELTESMTQPTAHVMNLAIL
ncbi:hypothetical protein CSAL01_07507 [Colletotrichum salicis]|uniref:Uncharacterized protein n=1 Tax=Colletotrichum salicis TaxID=1209931 RepID=A0A135SW51_9PEZI|nr:hypothetical protein CSAL01_07507 [Colletotrichum salicis]